MSEEFSPEPVMCTTPPVLETPVNFQGMTEVTEVTEDCEFHLVEVTELPPLPGTTPVPETPVKFEGMTEVTDVVDDCEPPPLPGSAYAPETSLLDSPEFGKAGSRGSGVSFSNIVELCAEQPEEIPNEVHTDLSMECNGATSFATKPPDQLTVVGQNGVLHNNLVSDKTTFPTHMDDARERRTTIQDDDGEDSESSSSVDSDYTEAVTHTNGHHGHGHGERPPSILTAMASAFINYLLMFGLCCAYGMIMFYDDSLAKHRALGVKMCLSTAMFTGLLLAWKSEIAVAIGGTDLNPVVFLGGFVVTIAEKIQEDLNISDMGMCEGDRYAQNTAVCDDFDEQIRATAIFTVSVSSAILGLLFFLLGFFRATRYVSYVPTSIMEAFLSCVGYKVFKYALKFCKYQPKQFIPAAFIGVLLYFIKALHIGNPAIVIPLVLLIPLGIFYFYIFVVRGDDLDVARKDKLMFPVIDNIPFWKVWTDGFLNAKQIRVKAWLETWQDLVIMIIVVVLDCLLKISSTESKLPVSVHKDYEIRLHGISNIFSTLSGSAVGYMQLKFNVINYGVMGNIRDRRGGAMYAIMCGVGFFTTIDHFNYLPRFFLGMLLFFAGAGFVAENLWGSRKYLSFREWGQILVILAVFVATEQLLIAVVVGGLLTGFDFIVRYAKVSCIAGRPLRGGEIPMVVRHGPLLQKNLQHIANSWLLVIRLKGFIFFASANAVTHFMKTKFAAQFDLPTYRRLRFIVFDCEQLDGMDASASKSMKKIVEEGGKIGIRVLWCSMDQDMKEALISRTIVKSADDLYEDVGQAVDYVHKLAVDYRTALHTRFMSLHPSFELYRKLSLSWAAFEPFFACFWLDIQRFGCPWQYCTRMSLTARETILHRYGERVMDLFLVHAGSVGIFNEDPFASPAQTSEHEAVADDPFAFPQAIYNQGWFLNREMLSGAPTRHTAVALTDGEVLVWTERDWIKMAREKPYMARGISKMIIKQQSRDHELQSLEMAANVMVHFERPIDMLDVDDHAEEIQAPSLRRRRSGTYTQLPEPQRETRRVSDVLRDKRMFGITPSVPGGVRPGCPLGLGLPEEMVQKLVGVQTAQVLEGFKLYEASRNASADEDVVLPPMPNGFHANLEIAFRTYCMLPERTIYWHQLNDVLMFAGVFNTVLDKSVPSKKLLTKSEVIAIAHRAVMAPFSTSQVRKIHNIFGRWDNDGSGRIGREELISSFREVFHPDFSIEEVEGVAGAWGVGLIGSLERMDFLDFLAVFSRFIRIHEQDWSLLNGFYDLMGTRFCSEQLQLTSEKLISTANGLLTREHAEEMLWAVDWRRDGGGEGKNLPFIDLIAAVLTNVDLVPGKLPPELKTSECVQNMDSTTSEALEQSDVDEDMDLQVKDFVLLKCKSASSTSESLNDIFPGMTMSSNPIYAQVEGLVSDLREAPRTIVDGATNDDSAKKIESCLLENMLSKMRTLQSIPSRELLAPKKRHSSRQSKLVYDHDMKAYEAKGFRAKVYRLVEMPASSIHARHLSVFMGVMIILSVISLFLEPLITAPDRDPTDTEEIVWRIIESCFATVFTIEFVVRISVCTSVSGNTIPGFMKTPSNICDFVALLPFYVEIILLTSKDGLRLLRTARLMKLIRLLRVSRVLRLNRLARLGKHGSSIGALAGPVAMVFTVVWGIYLLSLDD